MPVRMNRTLLAAALLIALPFVDVTAAPNPSTPGLRGSLRGGASGDIPFTPRTQGFRFQNYGNEEGYENLTAVEVERLFGSAVCEEEEAAHCALTPAAQRWMQTTNESMADGHCEGLATLSLMFDLGKASPKTFGSEIAYSLPVEGNKKLQREIAYWFSTQYIEPVASAELRTLTPAQVADKLTAAFRNNSESYTMGIYQPDGSEGHAITPYAVIDKGDDLTWVMVYDNNFPGEERHLEIHRAESTWSYFTAANPSDEGETYTGTAQTHSLTLTPLSARLTALECPFCGDVDDADTSEDADSDDDSDAANDAAEDRGHARGHTRSGQRQIVLEGKAHLLITDDHGKRLGHTATGALVNEIPNARAILGRSNRPRGDESEPLYELPEGSKLKIMLDGGALKATEPSDITMFGRGYALGVYDLKLAPGEKDTIEFSADDERIVYSTDKDETPEVELNIDTKGADYEFVVSSGGESSGQRLELGVNLKHGVFTVKASAHDGKSHFDVAVHRYTAHGEDVFTHKGIDVGANDRLVFNYANWSGNHNGMKVAVHRNGSKAVDEDETLTDED